MESRMTVCVLKHPEEVIFERAGTKGREKKKIESPPTAPNAISKSHKRLHEDLYMLLFINIQSAVIATMHKCIYEITLWQNIYN